VTGRPIDIACARARRDVHRVLDGEVLPLERARDHDAHLASCAECRQAADELGGIVRALAALPQETLPPDALERVRDRARERGRRSWGGVVRVAASLALVAALAAVWFEDVRDRRADDAELRQAADQVRLVLGIAGRAIERTEDAAIGAVLRDRVSGALDRLPVTWPDETPQRRDDT
jgi:predicted anti-sigma-YlaC factor YlaD